MISRSTIVNSKRKKWSVSNLEQRLMLAGDVAAAIADVSEVSTAKVDPVDQVQTDVAARVSRIVFVDASLEDADILTAAVANQSEIVLVENARNPIDQITKTLQGRQQIKQISIVTHGENGIVKFGETPINENTLIEHADQIQAWRSSLADGADILLYGCNVAEGDAGRALVRRLAELTGADVAASTDVTGNTAQGADWELEYTIGRVTQSELFCAATIRRYQHTLDVVVHAWGSTGDERIELLIDDQSVAIYDLNTQHQALLYQTNDTITADQVKIRFFNDAYVPSQNYDRNVTVESIQIDGQFYETEDVTVRSTGTWRAEDGVRTGFGRGEMLHANGEFQFGTNLPNDTGSQLQITARGQTGNERFALSVGNELIGDFDVSQGDYTFFYQTDSPIQANSVRIEFLNDAYQAGSFDNNLIVDKIAIDGQTFETEAPDVFSTGTWKPQDGVTPGFRQSEVLHTNGYFQFGANTQGETSLNPDTSFANNGVLAFSQSSTGFGQTPDGGFIRTDAGGQVLKYTADFTLDQNFGTGGTTTIPSQDPLGFREVTVLNDGTVVVLTRDGLTLDNFQLHRISASGQYLNSVQIDDLGAGPFTRFGGGPQVEATTSGKLILGGGKNNSDVVTLVGLNADLTIDTSFGNNGFADHSGLIGSFDSLIDIVATGDGGFISYGPLDTLEGSAGRSLYKFTSDGQLDSNFGNNGISELAPVSNFGTFIRNVKIDSLGRFVATNNSGFVRWTADGFLDTSFGNNGVANLQLPPIDVGGGQTRTLVSGRFGFDAQNRLVINTPALQSNISQPPTELGVLFGRLNEDGSSDTTLGTQFFAASTGQAVAGDILIDGQGRVIVIGGLAGSSFLLDPSVARYFFA